MTPNTSVPLSACRGLDSLKRRINSALALAGVKQVNSGMTLAFKHLITASDGDAEIAGKGLRVYTVLGLYEMGDSAESIAENYDVPIAAVYEALAYAADHSDEMEAITRADLEAEQRMLARMPEHVRRMAEEGIQEGEQARQQAIRGANEARRGAAIS